MNRDPLWAAIRDRLKAKAFSAETFERCAQDLLRELYPALVPVVGGSDGGMDGAVASAEGLLPLICTSDDDVLGNFRKSIGNHLRIRCGPRRCVLATSIFLTPQRRQNILDEAQRLGVVIEQIHEGEDFVGRLYVNPAWRKELLGVSGSPQALSVLPPRPRIYGDPGVVGRDADLLWLQETPGDLLLVGEPGSGKTYLHQALTLSGKALFAVTDDDTRLADAIRSQRPTVIVVDDAHVRMEWIDRLQRLRAEVGADFAIHANCWPGREAEVANRLSVVATRIRRLTRLSREVIVTLVHSMGIGGPDTLVYLLYEQSMGKPGLCAAMVDVAKREGVERVWSGEALADHLLSGSRLLRDEVDREALARFALGGDAGVDASRVAAAMGISPAMLADRMASLGAGGVLAEIDGGARLAVVPDRLRGVLVRDVFFRRIMRPDIVTAAADCWSDVDSTHVLIAAAQRGATVDRRQLARRVASCDDARLWEHYAYLDAAAATDILENHPAKVCVSGKGLLTHLGARAVSVLIATEGTERCPPEASVDHPYSLISEWLTPWDAEHRSGERRRDVVDAIERLARAEPGLSDDVLVKYVAAAIDPGISSTRSDLLRPNTVTFRRGVHSRATLAAILDLWPRAASLLPAGCSTPAWKKLFLSVSNWAFPARFNVGDDHELSDFMRNGAQSMLRDLLNSLHCDALRRHQIAWISDNAGFGLEVSKDNFFDVIFAERDLEQGMAEYEERRDGEFRSLVERLLQRGAETAARDLGAVERSVRGADIHGGWDRARLYSLLADAVNAPLSWLNAFIATEVPAQYLIPLISRAAIDDLSALLPVLRAMRDKSAYREIADRSILSNDEKLPWSLVEEAIDGVLPQGNTDEFRFPYPNLSIGVMSRLLNHSNSAVRSAAALGEWVRSPDRTVRRALWDDWARAIVDYDVSRDGLLGDLLAEFPDLGYQWARRRLELAAHRLWEHRRAVQMLAPKLSLEQRSSLVRLMNRNESFDIDWFNAVVQTDGMLFATWMDTVGDSPLALYPLREVPSDRWKLFTGIALERGVDAHSIASLAGSWGHSWMGKGSVYFARYVDEYKRLLEHQDPRFRVIAEAGLAWAQECVRQHLQREANDEM